LRRASRESLSYYNGKENRTSRTGGNERGNKAGGKGEKRGQSIVNEKPDIGLGVKDLRK